MAVRPIPAWKFARLLWHLGTRPTLVLEVRGPGRVLQGLRRRIGGGAWHGAHLWVAPNRLERALEILAAPEELLERAQELRRLYSGVRGQRTDPRVLDCRRELVRDFVRRWRELRDP